MEGAIPSSAGVGGVEIGGWDVLLWLLRVSGFPLFSPGGGAGRVGMSGALGAEVVGPLSGGATSVGAAEFVRGGGVGWLTGEVCSG